MLTTAGWWGEFWANLVADLLVALAVGIVLAQYLGIRSERKKRRELREKSLELILSELRINRDEVERVEELWAEGKLVMPYLETEAWRLASENQLLEGLAANLAGHLLKAYVELGHLEKKSRIMFEAQLAFREFPDPTKEQYKEIFQMIAEWARSCRQQLDKAIQALDSQSAG